MPMDWKGQSRFCPGRVRIWCRTRGTSTHYPSFEWDWAMLDIGTKATHPRKGTDWEVTELEETRVMLR